jgi:hypothetical protein
MDKCDFFIISLSIANTIMSVSVLIPTGHIYATFFNSHCGGWSPNWVHSARRPLNGLLYQPRVIMLMENLVE